MAVGKSRKILLAEDDASMRRFITVILEKAGHEVVAAADGLEALEAISNADFDAVVADAVMPKISGFDLCRMIRSGAAGRPVACIILSGLSESLEDDKIADAFIVKDTNLKENLLRTIETVIR